MTVDIPNGFPNGSEQLYLYIYIYMCACICIYTCSKEQHIYVHIDIHMYMYIRIHTYAGRKCASVGVGILVVLSYVDGFSGILLSDSDGVCSRGPCFVGGSISLPVHDPVEMSPRR